jgi:hypothetical protein
MLPPQEGQKHADRADGDRDYFHKKWGFKVDEPRYYETAADLNFTGDPTIFWKHKYGKLVS